MVDASTTVLGVVRTLVLIMGLSIAYLSYRAYNRTDSRYLRDAAIGFAIVTFGIFVEGALFEFGGMELVFVHIIESIVVAIGFGVLLYSLLR